jgi:hypothetical protein
VTRSEFTGDLANAEELGRPLGDLEQTDGYWLPRARRENATVARAAVIGPMMVAALTTSERLRPVAGRPSDEEPAAVNERTLGPYRAWRVSIR